jgi:thymidylate synthase (FAD)
MNNKIKLIWSTPEGDALIAYMARVSAPKNQHNTETAPKLISFLIKNKHVSPFEMCNACFEVNTTRAISAQILRHRSLHFQEFSQRYQTIDQLESFDQPEVRYKGSTNRQSSLEVNEDSGFFTKVKHYFAQKAVSLTIWVSVFIYNVLLDWGVAPESARNVLPMCVPTRLYINGTVRSWIHYLAVRTDSHTQKEHRELALEIESIIKTLYPSVWKAIELNG